MRLIGPAIILALSVILAPLAAEPQSAARLPRVSYLSPVSAGAPGHVIFRQSLRELGYVEGQNVVFEDRLADGHSDRLPVLAAELARLNVDVIVTASPPAIRAAKDATKTIPIVMITGDDPVRSGFVVNLARPGGNITGVTFLTVGLFAKQMELLKHAVPALRRVAFLWDPTMPTTTEDLTEVRTAARSLGLGLQVVEARGSSDYDGAFAAMAKEHAGALMIPGSPTFIQDRRRIVDLAAKQRLPTVLNFREDAQAGGLMSYGPSQVDMIRRAASHVDRILKGAKPADLPVEQPTKFELVINLKTARTLGLTIPQSVLLRAHQVID